MEFNDYFYSIIILSSLCPLTVVAGEQYHETPPTDLQFPTPADLVNFTNSKNSSAIIIPSSVVKERLGDGGK